MKINKKMIAVILIIVAVVAAIAVGCSVIGKDKKDNMDDVEKHNQQVLEEIYNDDHKDDDKKADEESDVKGKDKDKDKNKDDDSNKDSDDDSDKKDGDTDDADDTDDVDEDASGDTYEKWVAAASVTAISLTYPDFEIESILAASDTEFNDKEESKGAYVIFNSGGNKYAVSSKPLKKERSDKGTVDLYGQEIGFVTFDMVESDKIDTKKMKEIKIDELNTLISKSTLISLYEHY